MSAIALPEPHLQELIDANFARDGRRIAVHTDRMFISVMIFQFVLAIVLAVALSPHTWTGGLSSVHPHVWTALGLGGALAALPIFLAIRDAGTAHTRFVVAVSQALFSGLLIHLTNGRIETHFHVFGSLALLACYRDWRVLVTASAIIAGDHFVRGALLPASVYGVSEGAQWRFLEHAAWVVFEDTFLLVASARAIRDMKTTAHREAELQLANERIERAVLEAEGARDEAERANRAKSVFLSRMSHELRTPMNAILGFGQILQYDELTGDQTEAVDQILTAGRHLLRLIDDILDIAKIESGKADFALRPVDLTCAVGEIASMVQPLLSERHVSLNLGDVPAETESVQAEPRRLAQVLLNLVSNAIKYNVEGGEVCISAKRQGQFVRLLVVDTGIGISAESRAELFTPFERLGAEDSGVQGTGLGLTLTKSLVEAMEGRIGLLPTEVGCCFYVDLPIGEKADHEAIAPNMSDFNALIGNPRPVTA